jgi:hypothetical protein
LKAYCVLIAAAASPTFVLFVLGLLSNSPTAENEHLTNGALIELLGLDNATAQRYVVPMRSVSLVLHFKEKLLQINQ